MKLSVIIPLFNKEKYIERCLNSLLAQDISPIEYEIIIIDDGSKDSGAQIVQGYVEKHPNICLNSQSNQGPSIARNRCLEVAKGDYIYFLDADDLLTANVLGCLLELCEQNNLEILQFNSKEIENEALSDLPVNSSEEPQQLACPVTDGMSYISENNFRNEVWRYLIKRSFLLNSGIKFIDDMRAYEDLIFTTSVFLKSTRISRVELDAHRYVKVAGSIVTSKSYKKNLVFINNQEKAVEELKGLIENLNNSHKKHLDVVKKLKAKQQAVVFALLIRVIKYRLLNHEDLSLILDKMNKLGGYPIDRKIGAMGDGGLIFNRIIVPLFNTKNLLLLGTGILRLIPRS
ncbi:glycosyltransferase [Maribacter sp. HTCC2170]|uniref:glycosyltransferase n=1 Tax=Maribacter sp. (strain HTCC2170 / KCCM 42371) TaxID=313603 RepID=UPI00006B48ED|nr:glycosyltransferase [Maribacter sp. HTCC2170]EAR01115.1 hypothetical protein FB2170_10096 [Maribacter sp. HTCC2170]